MGKAKKQAASAARRAKKDKRRDRFDWWKLPWLLLIPLGLCWPRICAGRAELIERVYSTSVYPIVKDSLSVITSLVPFSVAELLLYALVAGVLIDVFGNLLVLLLRRISWKRMLSVLLNVAILGGVLINLFYFSWGFNYFRVPLQERMGLTVEARPTEALVRLTAQLANEANAARVYVNEDERGIATFTTDFRTTLDALPETYRALGEKNGVFAVRTTRAKRVLYSEGLSWAGIAGIYVGFTAEPNINAVQPPLLIPQGAAHEMAHQIGVASEDAAEFTGYLACMGSDDPFVRYSGVVGALQRCQSALHKVDAEAAHAVRNTCSEAVARDLADYDAYWAKYEGPIEEIADRTNDTYLKHNAQESGVQSYGEVVDLLLAYYDQTNN